MVAVPTKETMRYPVLDKHTEINFQTLAIIEQQLYTNARAVPSMLGNGRLGHTFLVLGQAAYTARANGTAFVPPVNPGNPPNLDGLTHPQIVAATNLYNARQAEWSIYMAMTDILLTQLIECVHERYYSSLIDRLEGISQHSLFDILQHLRTKHVKINDQQLRDNRAALEAPWEPDATIETLWLRVRDNVAFAHAGRDTIDNRTMVSATKEVLRKTGQFDHAIRTWNDKEEDDQTWANFQTHFEKANHHRLEAMTATDAGLGGGHAANAAVNTPTPGGNSAPAPGIQTGRSYCWTHGYCLGSNHTSLTCLHKATGHRDDATIANMFGGNNVIARNRDQPAVYRNPRHTNGNNGAATPST
jgi:hypothetical protein